MVGEISLGDRSWQTPECAAVTRGDGGTVGRSGVVLLTPNVVARRPSLPRERRGHVVEGHGVHVSSDSPVRPCLESPKASDV